MRRLSQSWNILSGYCGQISLGHALYFGLGAYTTALLFTKFGVLPWFGMLGGGLISAVIAMALGYPCFRLRGHYFVIATIVIAETALLLFQNWDWAGAALGIDIPVRGDSWLKFQFVRSKLPYFYFALALACVAWLVTWWLENSKWGYWWRRGEGQPGCRRKPGRGGVQFQDGRGRGLGVSHRNRRQLLRAVRLLYRPRKRHGIPVLAADGAARRCWAASAPCGDRCWGRSFSFRSPN